MRDLSIKKLPRPGLSVKQLYALSVVIRGIKRSLYPSDLTCIGLLAFEPGSPHRKCGMIVCPWLKTRPDYTTEALKQKIKGRFKKVLGDYGIISKAGKKQKSYKILFSNF